VVTRIGDSAGINLTEGAALMVMSAERKLRALQAAQEWVGCYGSDDGGTIGAGDRTGVPDDMLDAYELLGNLAKKVQHDLMVEKVAKAIRDRHPEIPLSRICKEARRQVVAHEASIPA
jgi:hypothetical protein